MTYIPRTTEPSLDNLYYIVTSAGGYNECIEIANGSALPNCVGYAWGATYEATGERPTLSRNVAAGWFGYTEDGYQRGSIPALGAIACYSGGTGGDGHVAVVIEVYDNGDIETANSAYGGSRWWSQRITKASNYNFQSGYIFQGFIYAGDVPIPPIGVSGKFPWVLYARKLRGRR